MKKKLLITLAAAVVLAGAAFGGYCVYLLGTAHPDVRLIELGDPDSEQYFQTFFLVFAYTDHPILLSREKAMDDLARWSSEQDSVFIDAFEQGRPLHVLANCRAERGKTIFRYEGEIAGKDGDIQPYHEEFTLNWTFADNEQLSHLETAMHIKQPFPAASQSRDGTA